MDGNVQHQQFATNENNQTSNPYSNFQPFNQTPQQSDSVNVTPDLQQDIPNPFAEDLEFQFTNMSNDNFQNGVAINSNENNSQNQFQSCQNSNEMYNYSEINNAHPFSQNQLPIHQPSQMQIINPAQMSLQDNFQMPPIGPLPTMPPFMPPMFDPNLPFVPPMIPGMLNMPLLPTQALNASPAPQPFADINFNEEVWLQAMSRENKVYFIEVKSERTQWDKPQDVKNPIQDHKDYVAIKDAYSSWLEKNPQQKLALVGSKNSVTESTKNSQKSKVFIPSEVVEWSKHLSVDNEVFYYNTRTKKSVWDKPDVLIKWEESQQNRAKEADNQGQSQAAKTNGNNSQKNSNNTKENATNKNKENSSAAKQDESSQQQPKKAPRELIPIPNSKYLMVLQQSGRVFYYDKMTRTSTYSLPETLKGRTDLKELEEKLEEQAKKKLEQSAVESGKEPEPKKPKEDENDSHIENVIAQYKQMSFDKKQKLFMELLSEKKVSAFSTWKNELHKIVNDDRYLCLDSNERKSVFEKYCKERAIIEKEEKMKQLKLLKSDFLELLKESKVDKKTSFIEFSNKFGKDDRFKAIEKKRERETLFDEFQSSLKREHHEKLAERGKMKDDFFALLETVRSKIVNDQLNYRAVRKLIENDERFIAIESKEDRHKYYDEFISTIKQSKPSPAAQSLKDREIEVAKALERASYQSAREKSAAQQNDARDSLKAILIDVVKNPMTNWEDIKKKVYSDQRWDNCTNMKKRTRDEIFDQHIEMLKKKSTELLCDIYCELGVTVDSKWSEELKSKTRKHSTFVKVSDPSSKHLESEFKNYIYQLKKKAVADFKLLLKETKLITHKTNSQLDQSVFKEIITALESDQRYRVLGKSMKDERRHILLGYIEKLEQQGPPPSIHTANQ